MRLLIVVDAFPPLRTSAALQIRDLATALARQGHQCVVITPDSKIEGLFRLDEQGNNRVLRLRSAPTKRIALVRRAINEILLSWRMWRGFRATPLMQESFDGIIFYSPSIFFGPFITRLKRHFGCPAYLILRDIFPDWAVDLGLMRRGPAYWLFKAFEHHQYRVADTIGVESPSSLAYFRNRPGGVEVLHNWVDLTANPTNRLPISTNSSGTKTFVYAGTIGVAQDMDNLLRLARRLCDRRDIRLLLIGAGSEASRIGQVIKNEGIANIEMHDEVEPECLRGMLQSCDVGLISLDRRLRSHNVPGKLMTYLEFGLPVLASVNPENILKEIIESADAGMVLWNGDDAAFEAAARQLADDADLRKHMAESARQLCERRFSADSVAGQITSRIAPG